MKKKYCRYLLTGMLFYLCAYNASFAQYMPSAWEYARAYIYNKSARTRGKKPIKVEEPVAQEWQVVCRIADTSIFMCTLDTTSFYLGKITSLKSGKTIRSGYGISLENGTVYIGNWKRDLKHGNGIVENDSTILSGVWKWGKPKREKMHKASESEISLLEARKKLLKEIIELF